MAAGIVDVALSQEGTAESGNNNVPYNTWYYGHPVSGDDYPWCAVFVSWCAEQSGEANRMPRTAGVDGFYNYAKNNGLYKTKGSYIPKAGDIFIHKSAGASHTGIVIAADNSKYYTIEGNSSNKVQKCSYSLSNPKLTGFFTPSYNNQPYSGASVVIPTAVGQSGDQPGLGPVLGTGFSAEYKDYTWKKGDTLQSVADKFNTTVAMLMFLNNLEGEPKVGDTIKVPSNSQGNVSYESSANIKKKHTVSVTVSHPTIEVVFYTEKGELAATSQEGTAEETGLDNDIISLTTNRNMKNDCPTFNINLVWRNKWFHNLAPNDLLVIYLQRPPERKRAVFFGLIDDMRRSYDFSSTQPQRVCQITGRGFAKAFVNFDVGMITNMGLTNSGMGFNSNLLAMEQKSSAECIEQLIKDYVGTAIKYTFSNGKTYDDYFKSKLSCHDGEKYGDATNILSYVGSLWNLIKEFSNTPFNETYWEIDGDNPTMIHRETPFNPDNWNSLPITTIQDDNIVSDGLGRSDLETYTLYRVLYSFDTTLSSCWNPLWYKPFYDKYGLSILEVQTPFMVMGGGSSGTVNGINVTPTEDGDEPDEMDNARNSGDAFSNFQIDLYNWNVLNNKMANGNITVKGKAAYKVGERVILEGENLELYVEGVTHNFNLYQSWTTTLELTRGLQPNDRFRPPWDCYEDFTDAEMAAIVKATGGEIIDWTNIAPVNYSDYYGNGGGMNYNNPALSTVNISQCKSNIDAIFTLLKAAGLNTAAACGVLANIDNESGFNPGSVGDSGTSYGLCQWHNSRKTGVMNYCKQKYGDTASLKGQVEYFFQEVGSGGYGSFNMPFLTSVPNTTQGAYDVAHKMCINYEVPSNKESKAVSRGNLAVQTYCPMYGLGTSREGSQQTYVNPPGGTATGLGPAAVQVGYTAIGHPYVWGGNSLYNGCDCSHFVTLCLQQAGYTGGYTTSGGWRSRGTGVSAEQAQIGDVLCYNGHVAFYVDRNHILHAQSSKTGIVLSETNPFTYHNGCLAIRRI